MQPLTTIPLAEIQAAAERIAGLAVRTPLVRLSAFGPAEIWLKLENLQPIGSFKLRGAGNALLQLAADQLRDGVYTASAGNMAQGVAYVARRRSVPCRVVVPDHAPATKLAAIERLGGEIVKLPFAQWWNVLLQRGLAGMRGHFVHPVSDPAVIAGNGTIGLEILADLPDVDTVVVPYGGGGLASGIASLLRALRPQVKVFAAEVVTAAPLHAALAADAPVPIDYVASFVDGIGGRGLLPEMWPMVRDLLAGSVVVTLEQVADAIRLLVERNRVVAEGAGAASVAAALTGRTGNGKIVCVVSGGNLDTAKLARILAGELP